ncbi:PD-(D/E)XK motif protein [Ruminococcus albus]|uniref:PD-(D/E)XK family member n=1 Tax=Ruminococcus albus (strain ATCC 27210 / DSM 20455 / JCM 14654 / NCDO 2250 / 7) TaxID=697329 RepID=E6UHK3_RUMA7|nr:PD-(D/E)XK motif protein [Ruminococcus albus]ADU21248.1 hypothetical protein Rumal_0706 [Ruminococcus albus 7 = DSM 20455]
MTTTEISDLWKVISVNTGVTTARRIDAEHPLDFFASYDEENRMQLLLISDILPVLPNSSKQILVRANPRNDGKFAICFSLTDSALKELFFSLTWDIMNCTYDISDRHVGINKAVSRFKKWQKMFAASKDKMSSTQVKGLIGELILLRDICIDKYGVKKAIEGWVGPLGTDQDFQFDDTWYEAKAVSASMDKVNISSFEQFESDKDGFLIVNRIENTSPLDPDSFTLKTLTQRIYDIISNDADLKSLFHMRLILYGYNETDDHYDESYKLIATEKYLVDEAFPKIIRSKLDASICDGSYEISIPAIQGWRIV